MGIATEGFNASETVYTKIAPACNQRRDPGLGDPASVRDKLTRPGPCGRAVVAAWCGKDPGSDRIFSVAGIGV